MQGEGIERMVLSAQTVFVGFASPHKVKSADTAVDTILQAIGEGNNAGAQRGIDRIVRCIVEVGGVMEGKAAQVCDSSRSVGEGKEF